MSLRSTKTNSFQCLLPFMFSHQNPACITHFSHKCDMSCQPQIGDYVQQTGRKNPTKNTSQAFRYLIPDTWARYLQVWYRPCERNVECNWRTETWCGKVYLTMKKYNYFVN